MRDDQEAAREEAQAIMDRVQRLEEKWIDSLGGMEEVSEILQEAEELMGEARRMERREPWQLALGRLTARLHVMNHSWKILFHQIQGIYQVDPLFEPDPDRAP